jgi:hypothetical protein
LPESAWCGRESSSSYGKRGEELTYRPTAWMSVSTSVANGSGAQDRVLWANACEVFGRKGDVLTAASE